jgi:hypothetical protein
MRLETMTLLRSTVNGREIELEIESRELLIDLLRVRLNSLVPSAPVIPRSAAPAPCFWTVSRSAPAALWLTKPTAGQ